MARKNIELSSEDVTPARSRVKFVSADPFGTSDLAKSDDGPASLSKSLCRLLDGPGSDSVERLAFTVDPYAMSGPFAALYRPKLRLLPDALLKRLGIQDNLVAGILTTRSNQVSAFGRPQPDRFSTGYKIVPRTGIMETLKPEEREALQKKIAIGESRFLTCGKPGGKPLTFSQYLYMSARNACLFGRIATEKIPNEAGEFHSFRPIDAGTIYLATAKKNVAEAKRREALLELSRLKLRDQQNRPVERVLEDGDEYEYVQVINDRVKQFFTSDECVVHNFYPTTDIELEGYPITPLDTCISDVTTHINISTQNRLFFQSGRAARGAFAIQSDDVDDVVLMQIRQHFQASINSVGNSFRIPIFRVGSEDKISWFPIDSQSRDMEFQYLSDSNARALMTAFNMSPEELPGFAHLSKGTNSQSMSEGNNEYLLEAHRDTGIRPLLGQLQNFINADLFPDICPDLVDTCSFRFVGLDAESADKESARLQTDSAVHYTYNQIMQKVEKSTIKKDLGGDFPLNPMFQNILDRYLTVGQILENFFDVEGASQKPELNYRRDPFWFNQMQFLQTKQQMEMQAAQPQQGQDPNQQQPQPGDQPDSAQQGASVQADQANKLQAAGQGQMGGAANEPAHGDLSTGIDQLAGLLNKSELHLPDGKRRLLAQQRLFIKNAMAVLQEESKSAVKEIAAIALKHAEHLE